MFVSMMTFIIPNTVSLQLLLYKPISRNFGENSSANCQKFRCRCSKSSNDSAGIIIQLELDQERQAKLDAEKREQTALAEKQAALAEIERLKALLTKNNLNS